MPEITTNFPGFGQTTYTKTQINGSAAPKPRTHFSRWVSSNFTNPEIVAKSVYKRHLVALEMKNVENKTATAPIRKTPTAYPPNTGVYMTESVRMRSCFSGNNPKRPSTAAPSK